MRFTFSSSEEFTMASQFDDYDSYYYYVLINCPVIYVVNYL